MNYLYGIYKYFSSHKFLVYMADSEETKIPTPTEHLHHGEHAHHDHAPQHQQAAKVPTSKNSNMLLYIGIVAIVIIVVGYLLFHGSIGTSALYNTTVSGATLSNLSRIANNQTLAAAVGTTAYAGLNPSAYIKIINESPLKYNGKPEVLFVGAEFCPYCAASRWAMVLALMRFGNITGLTYSESSSTDVDPSTPTFSFLNYTYTSSYLSFNAFETESRTSQPLQSLDPISQGLYSKYGDAIPFMDFGNYFVESGSVVNPAIFKGLSWGTITSQLTQPNTTVSQEVIGAANLYTAEICYTINETAPICKQPYVTGAKNKFLA
jgi:hypothetical protein